MKKLPIGNSDFRDIIENDDYFVDKTLFIKEVLDRGDKILLIPRPRRFGKTLNMTMLKYFFGNNIEPSLVTTDNSILFENLKIWKEGKEYIEKQGKYPVIFLTFKDVKDHDFLTSCRKIQWLLAEEFGKNDYLLKSGMMTNEETEIFNGVLCRKSEKSEIENSLKFLIKLLVKHHKKRVLLLIDEYDAPIHSSFVNKFYGDMISFMKNFLSAGLKDMSEYIEKAVLTGIMRVAKESIFSGLNNLGVFTILDGIFSGSFGFTVEEVGELLKSCEIENKTNEVREWYDGYIFGKTVIYNPWSIVNYASRGGDKPQAFWVNTSDNAIVDEMMRSGGKGLKMEIESLLNGEGIEKVIDDNIVFNDLFSNDGTLWSFLLMGGYLKGEFLRKIKAEDIYRLSIPNLEVESVYCAILNKYFKDAASVNQIEEMLKYLKKGEVETFGKLFRQLVKSLFSYYDFGSEPEKVYHAFTAGLLVWLSAEYEVKSNRESGYGRYDIMLIPKKLNLPGYVIEFKRVDEDETAEKALASAIKQLKEKEYETELIDKGVAVIHKLAIIFEGKNATVAEVAE